MSARSEAAAGAIAVHYRRDVGSCGCGWGVDTGHLGESHAAHVAELALAAADAAAAVAAAPTEDDPVLALEAARAVAAQQGYTVVLTAVALHVANIAESTGERNSSIWSLRGAARAAAAQRRDLRGGAAPVPPAPSAGEDEAAVERAARAMHHAVNGAPGGLTWDDWRDNARAVLAAARGPRTQDGQS